MGLLRPEACVKTMLIAGLAARDHSIDLRPRKPDETPTSGTSREPNAIQRALDQNLDLAASVTRVEQEGAAAKEAGARLKPSGALSAQSSSLCQSLESAIGRLAGTSPRFDRNQSYLDLGVAASWEIDLSGGRSPLAHDKIAWYAGTMGCMCQTGRTQWRK